jgi:hypothetical protein
MKKFIIKKVVPKAIYTWEVEAENQEDADFAIYKRYDNAILKKHETFDADYGDADFTIFENDLSNFSSEELLYEVYKRKDVYLENYYFKEHLIDRGIGKEFHKQFITDFTDGMQVDEAIECWKSSKQKELEIYLSESIAQHYNLSKEEADLFSDCVQVDYDVELGFTPSLERPASEFAGTTFWDSSSELARKLTEICKPHQGNIKTYLEEKMQELINEYFNFTEIILDNNKS